MAWRQPGDMPLSETMIVRLSTHICVTRPEWVEYQSRTHHDDVIKWKHFPRNWPFVRGIHRSRVNSPHKGQWRGALMFSLICVWINDWVNNREAGDLRRYRGHYDVIVMMREKEHGHDSIGMQIPLFIRVLTAGPSTDVMLTTELYLISA